MKRHSGVSSGLVWAIQGLLLATALVAWESAGRLNRQAHFYFSKPTSIFMRMWEWLSSGEIWSHMALTLWETVLGFLVGVVLGLVLAFVCYYSPLTERVLLPFFTLANAVPRVILGPIFILWFGLGVASKVALGISLILFIVFFSTFQGLKEVDPSLIYKVRLLGGSERDVMRYVLLPSALVWVFTSLRTSVGFALVGAVVGEYMGSAKGMGHLIQFAEGMFDATGVFAGLMMLSLMVLVMNLGLERLEARFTAWQLR
ncbi:MAG: ABC transporter permease [Bacillota bacterium]